MKKVVNLSTEKKIRKAIEKRIKEKGYDYTVDQAYEKLVAAFEKMGDKGVEYYFTNYRVFLETNERTGKTTIFDCAAFDAVNMLEYDKTNRNYSVNEVGKITFSRFDPILHNSNTLKQKTQVEPNNQDGDERDID